jgi:hypothetical protein
MIMARPDQTTFPKFTKYVRFSLPTVVDVRSIVAAFAKYGQIDRATLKRALTLSKNSRTVTASARPNGTRTSFLVGSRCCTSWFIGRDNLDGIDFLDKEGEQFETDVYGMVINE